VEEPVRKAKLHLELASEESRTHTYMTPEVRIYLVHYWCSSLSINC
jgi:hypothetical protein